MRQLSNRWTLLGVNLNVSQNLQKQEQFRIKQVNNIWEEFRSRKILSDYETYGDLLKRTPLKKVNKTAEDGSSMELTQPRNQTEHKALEMPRQGKNLTSRQKCSGKTQWKTQNLGKTVVEIHAGAVTPPSPLGKFLQNLFGRVLGGKIEVCYVNAYTAVLGK
nr:hypothetical protein Iba_chr03bCG3780 [Ipomoea batatas]